MIDPAFVAVAVEDQYGIKSAAIHPLQQHRFDGRGIYRIDDGDGHAWVLRLVRQEAAIPWLFKPAALLAWLAQHQFRAPHVQPTQTRALVGSHGGWSMLMLAYIDGAVGDPTPATLRLVGDALGQLHTQNVPLDGAAAELPRSWWHPAQAFPAALDQLSELEASLPRALHPLHNALCATLRNVQQHAADLPQRIIHGDCWYANAIRTPENGVVFIDWDCAGLGPAILDLGNLLLTSHYNLARPGQVHPDAARIGAIVAAYRQHRLITAIERKLLIDAIRFGLAFNGARYLEHLEGDWREHLGVQKLQTRFAATEAIAELALTSLEETAC